MTCKRVGDAIVCSRRKRDPELACMVCGAPVTFDRFRLAHLCATCSDDSKRDPAFAAWAERQVRRFG